MKIGGHAEHQPQRGRDHWKPTSGAWLRPATAGVSRQRGATDCTATLFPSCSASTIAHVPRSPGAAAADHRAAVVRHPGYCDSASLAAGDVARVPPFDRSLLLNVDFTPQRCCRCRRRGRGWQGIRGILARCSGGDPAGSRNLGSTATADDSGSPSAESVAGYRLGSRTEPICGSGAPRRFWQVQSVRRAMCCDYRQPAMATPSYWPNCGGISSVG